MHNIKLPSRWVPLYPQMSAGLRPHQRNVLVQRVVNAEAWNSTRLREQASLGCSFTFGTSRIHRVLKVQGPSQRRVRLKELGVGGTLQNTVFWTRWDYCAPELTKDTVACPHQIKPANILEWGGKGLVSPTPN